LGAAVRTEQLRQTQVWTFAITENMRNYNNTPDIGFQIGWAYSPAFMR